MRKRRLFSFRSVCTHDCTQGEMTVSQTQTIDLADQQAAVEHRNDVRTGYRSQEADGGCADVLCTYCVLRSAMVLDVIRARHGLAVVR